LQRAQQIMFARQHTQLDIEHVFLALLQQRDSLTAQIITHLGGDPQAMIRQLETALNSVQSYPGSRGVSTGYITLRCNRVLQGAAEEADRLNDEYISTRHLLLAIAREQGGTSGKLLLEAAIDRNKILSVLDELPDTEHRRSREDAQTAYSKTIFNPPSLARPVGFSHGIRTIGGHVLFLAGQTALDTAGRIVAPGDIVAQYRQVLANLQQVVHAAGGQMQNIVKMTIFVKDRDDYKAHLKELGQVHKSFFGAYYPAIALLEISRFFDDDAMIEIEGIAVLEEDNTSV